MNTERLTTQGEKQWIIDFVETVRDMRINQKNFFATRSHDYLMKAKSLERKIDDMLGRIIVNKEGR